MRTWILGVAALAMLGLSACGSDDGGDNGNGTGSGGIKSNPCVAEPLGEACQQCAMAAGVCLDAGKCADESDELDACNDACTSETACCSDEARAFASCMQHDCPDAAPCYRF